MPLAVRNGGKCAFCAFRSLERMIPTFGQPISKRYGVRERHDFAEVRRRSYDYVDAPDSIPRRGRSVAPPRKGIPTRPVTASGSHHLELGIRGHPASTGLAVHRPLLSTGESTYGVFGRLLVEQVGVLRVRLHNKDKPLFQAWGIQSEEELEEKLASFLEAIEESIKLADRAIVSKAENPLFFRLRQAFILGNVKELVSEVRYAFINHVVSAHFSIQDKTNQDKLADLRYPLEWYPATRAMQRQVHLHVGPTNSGKTYHALQALEKAEEGVYAGPLRLLAHEVYSRFNAKGKLCALVTGEERRIPEGMTGVMSSCTVEMVPLNTPVDVAVIDEIQMMSDVERGWAWTQAFLGVQAKEVHLCGELRTIELVKEICRATGDKLHIHTYTRLSPLEMDKQSLRGDLKNLQKGDAVILFSRVAIHAMKSDIEKVTGKRCAVVYGSLPPETRAQQAALFNDPNNDYDFLVASDAVGMGLNLSIKRIIFEATSKHDGVGMRLIRTSEIKQIAGRAGRYKTADDATKVDEGGSKKVVPNKGLVTTLEHFDMPIVRKAMETEVEPLRSAGIFPPSNILLRFANYFPPKTPFSFIVLRLHEISSTHPSFFLCRLKEQIHVADIIEPYNLSNMDRIVFMSAPVAVREAGFSDVLCEMAECVALQSSGELLDLKSLDLEMLDMDIHAHPKGSKGYLKAAETLHKGLTLYLWLSYRFVGIFRSQALAFHVKALVEEKIDECLAEVHWDLKKRRQLKYLRRQVIEEQKGDLEVAEAVGVDPESVRMPPELDGSDADEAFEDQATEMVSSEEASREGLGDIPPPTEDAREHGTINV